MGYRETTYHYVACVTGTSQGQDGYNLVSEYILDWDAKSREQALAIGRAKVTTGGWQRVVADDIFEHHSMAH